MKKCFFFLFVCMACGAVLKAQQLEITYQQPLQYQKVNGRLMAAGLIRYTGKQKGLSVELDGKTVAYQRLSDSVISINLPLIGKDCDIRVKGGSRFIAAQKFTPVIPETGDISKTERLILSIPPIRILPG